MNLTSSIPLSEFGEGEANAASRGEVNTSRSYGFGINGAEQPCLVVNDLKLGETQGQIALWIGSGTEAYFSTVAVK